MSPHIRGGWGLQKLAKGEGECEILYKNRGLAMKREFSKKGGMPNFFYWSEYSDYNGTKI